MSGLGGGVEKHGVWRFELPVERQDEIEGLLIECGYHEFHVDRKAGEAIGRLGLSAPEEGGEGLRAALALLREAGLKELGVEIREDGEWIREWKESLKPFELIPGLWVNPDLSKELPGVRSLRIEPSYAFGTGHHATTRGASSLVHRHLRAGESFLDVGCGTAILALVAFEKNPSRVRARDNDPFAVKRAKETLALHGHPEVLVEEASLLDGLDSAEGRWDVIAANIVTEVLVSLLASPLLKLLLAPGGRLVLSGIHVPGRPLIAEALADRGWDIREEIQEEGWTSLLVVPSGDSK